MLTQKGLKQAEKNGTSAFNCRDYIRDQKDNLYD